MLGVGKIPCTGERAVGVSSAVAAQSKQDQLLTILNEADLVALTGLAMQGGDASGAYQLGQLPTFDGDFAASLVHMCYPCTIERAAAVSLAAAAWSEYDIISTLLNKTDLVELSGQVMRGGNASSAKQQHLTLVY